MYLRARFAVFVLSLLWICYTIVSAQSLTSGTITGKAVDPSGAVIPGASVEIHNPVTDYKESATTDSAGSFSFRNIPFNPYHLTVAAKGFQEQEEDVNVRSAVPVNLTVRLQIAGTSETVNVEASGQDLIENNATAHTDVSSSLAQTLPKESVSTGLSSVISDASPGIAADSNGMFHPLGEHSDTTFSIDNQPISDQQSRTFSNQLSMNNIQSMEIITGVPPAEYGDKASLVVYATTRSALGSSKPFGSVTAGYGSFGTSTGAVTFGMGNSKLGNFLSVDGVNSGRFLDSPEFLPIHDKGNVENLFDRFDYQLNAADTLHLNWWLSRSWFQIPNDFDQMNAGQDQRQELKTFNFAPGYTHLINASTLLTVNAYVRQDRVGYFPSADRFADQPATLSQGRRLTNAGAKVDVSYVKGIHNAKAGVSFYHTFLSENFQTGLTDPLFNPLCVNAAGGGVVAPGVLNPAQCAGAGFLPNPGFQPGLLPFDLTRGGARFNFRSTTDIKQEAAYVEDTISVHQFSILAGLRGDNYNGLSSGSAIEPRVGVSHHIKRTSTVLRASYGRLFLTPYNENLILSSSTGQGGLAQQVFGAYGAQPITPARRNMFDVGFEQAIDRHFSITADYFWKFTTGDYDFDVILNTPLAFPIQWKKSKIDGFSARINFAAWHGLTAYMVMGHARSRFFGPEVGGIIFNSPVVDNGPFRIDHDQEFEQNTHLQYQVGKWGPWFGFSWDYQSGLVAGAVPDFATALGFDPNQQAQIGLYCGNRFATPTSGISSCSSPIFGATRVRIPATGTYNPDTNPARIAPRHLFDLGTGMDNVFRTEPYHVNLSFSVVNLTNKVALYNSLSTFSGTHFVTPRSYQASLGVSF
ncbi:MAG: TonB-dependent receptor [Chlamydiota bacterium]